MAESTDAMRQTQVLVLSLLPLTSYLSHSFKILKNGNGNDRALFIGLGELDGVRQVG